MKFLCLALTLSALTSVDGVCAESVLEAAPEIAVDSYLPGVTLATGITEVTGVAISPLLGVSGVGVWTYFRTPSEFRGSLPWYCQPLAWGIGLFVLTLCFFKDTLGTILPAFFKKPLDLLELFENKASAIIASAGFVPLVANQIMVHLDASETPSAGMSALAAGGFVAQVPALGAVSFSAHWIILPLCLIGFFLVWIVSHALNILILLSPFGLLDTALKAARLGLLSLIAVAFAINPILAAVLSGIVITIAAFLAPSAFRLAVFGTFMGTDYLRSLIWKEEELNAVRGFLAKRGGTLLKARAFGSLRRSDEGAILFESRFCFFGPKRILSLSDAETLVVANGMLFPSILGAATETGARHSLLFLLPRHRHQIHGISEKLGFEEVRETPLNRGVAAMKVWLKETINVGKRNLLSQGSDAADDSN